jgi:dipeptidyl-peptidase 4
LDSLFSPFKLKTDNDMRKVFLFILLFASLQTIAQHKQITLEDAILGASSYLRPETMEGLAWQNDEVFTYVENDTLWAETAKKGGKTIVTTRDEINTYVNPAVKLLS